MKKLIGLCAALVAATGWAGEVKSGRVVGERYFPGTLCYFSCWAPDGLRDGEGAVYVFLEQDVATSRAAAEPLMANGTIPKGMIVNFPAGVLQATAGGADRGVRACKFDQPGTEYPSSIAEEIIPAAEKLLGVKASPSPDLHFIAGGSSGGIAAWNACWYRNDFFRRCFLSSPTFSNMRGGNQLMPLVRKCEARPIRAYVTTGTDEPDYFFGDSYLVAMDAVSALRFAGYETRFDRFVGEGHCAHYGDTAQIAKVLTWLFEDWKTKPVAAPANPIRVRDIVVKGTAWRVCNFKMPSAAREVRSSDRWRIYSVSPDSRFVMSERLGADGRRDQPIRLAPLELAWNATRVGGTAVAVASTDRLFVATELGVQCVVSFGLVDAILPLPDDLPCDNVALVGTNLYASSGEQVFCRPIQMAAADPEQTVKPSTPGYDDGFWYSRRHEPGNGIVELFGSSFTAGRVEGVVSCLSDRNCREQCDCAGDADRKARRAMSASTVFAVPSMKKAFAGAAIMCAIDEGRISLDEAVSKGLPESAVGEPFETYLRRKILDPLGMNDTTCTNGLATSARDLIRFAEMLAHHGEWQGKRLVSRTTFDGVLDACGFRRDGDWLSCADAPSVGFCVNPKTGHSRVLFVRAADRDDGTVFQLKRDWHAECDRLQGTPPTVFGK